MNYLILLVISFVIFAFLVFIYDKGGPIESRLNIWDNANQYQRNQRFRNMNHKNLSQVVKNSINTVNYGIRKTKRSVKKTTQHFKNSLKNL